MKREVGPIIIHIFLLYSNSLDSQIKKIGF